MENKGSYDVFTYADRLTPGEKFKMEHSIFFNEKNADISMLSTFLEKTSSVPIGFEPIEGAKGYYHQNEKRIAINEGMGQPGKKPPITLTTSASRNFRAS